MEQSFLSRISVDEVHSLKPLFYCNFPSEPFLDGWQWLQAEAKLWLVGQRVEQSPLEAPTQAADYIDLNLPN